MDNISKPSKVKFYWLTNKCSLGFIDNVLASSEWAEITALRSFYFQYSASEQDVMKAKLEERVGLKISESDRPKNSKLYKWVSADY